MEEKKNIMDYDTVSLDDENSAVVIIDQTKLPGTYRDYCTERPHRKSGMQFICFRYVALRPLVWQQLTVSMYWQKELIQIIMMHFYAEFKKQKEYLDSSRPTAVNLSWALNRMEQVVLSNNADQVPLQRSRQLLKEESVEIQDEDIRVCKAIGEYGLDAGKTG